jgi:hypothetical protein
LQCAVDPRKQENLDAGRKTVWANIGAQQFHLPEGKPDAQVLEGVVTLVYNDLAGLQIRHDRVLSALQNSQFSMTTKVDEHDVTYLRVTDPWGIEFCLVQGDESNRDSRGQQPGGVSQGLAMRDLTIYTSRNSNMAGIARFYEQVLCAPILSASDKCVVVSVGPRQTLSFRPHAEKEHVQHDDLVNEQVTTSSEDCSAASLSNERYWSNYGPHISIYVADLTGTYHRVEKLGALYVNPRFKRQAYTLDQAIDDCMFRCLDIVDPNNVDAGPILRLEHEIRSVVTRSGSKYKSCPFDEVPEACMSR